MKKYKIAVLDDYQNVALRSADWSVVRERADIAVFQDHLADLDAVIERLLPFDVVCVMRERTPLPRNVIERLPNLKLIASTGAGNASIDMARRGRAWNRSGSHRLQVGPNDRTHLGADLGLRAAYRDGEQLRPIRRLAENNGHGSPWKDPWRSGTWADWITGRAGREGFWNESDCLEPEPDARGRQSRGRNPGLQGPTVLAGRYPDDPFGVEQPYARPGRSRGAGENETNGPVDQRVARADRRRASFDQLVEEQANRWRGDRRIRH
jgi:hypothetical protein